MNEKGPRYPYTHACDYIRELAGYDSYGTKLSRSDASHIMGKISELAGIDKETLAERLADAELGKTDEDSQQQVLEGLRALGLYGETE